MKLKSLYHFFRTHFGYDQASPQQARAYGMAIQDFERIFVEAYYEQSFQPFDNYPQEQHARDLTKTFLINARNLASNRFADPFAELRYVIWKIVSKSHKAY